MSYDRYRVPATPVTRELARGTAYFILTSDGWSYDHETAEFVDPTTGRRGRLCYFPDETGERCTAVKLQLPGRRPTLRDMLTRTPTVGAFIDVWSVEGEV